MTSTTVNQEKQMVIIPTFTIVLEGQRQQSIAPFLVCMCAFLCFVLFKRFRVATLAFSRHSSYNSNLVAI